MSLSTTMLLDDSLQLSPTPKAHTRSQTKTTTTPTHAHSNNSPTDTNHKTTTTLFSFPEEPYAEELDQVQEERNALELQLTHQVKQLQAQMQVTKQAMQERRGGASPLSSQRQLQPQRHDEHPQTVPVPNQSGTATTTTMEQQSTRIHAADTHVVRFQSQTWVEQSHPARQHPPDRMQNSIQPPIRQHNQQNDGFSSSKRRIASQQSSKSSS
jgi:hypothetical protein